MEPPELTILVPVLGRAHLIPPLLTSIEQTTDVAHETLFVVSPDDDEGAAEAREWARPHGVVRVVEADWPGGVAGDYARKINLGYRESSSPLLFLAATDLRFHPRWFQYASRLFAAPSVGVVGTNDLGNRRTFSGRHSTHSLVTRRYVDKFGTIDEPGKVLHEGYPHEYVDDEFVRTAKYRRAYEHARRSHVEHLHPNWSKAPWDPLYGDEQRRMEIGRALFRERQHLWHGTVR